MGSSRFWPIIQNVAGVAVVGVPDDRWGEQVAAVVRLGAPVTDGDLAGSCRDRLAPHKIPKI